MTDEKRIISIPPCHDKKCLEPVNADFIAQSIKEQLVIHADLSDEYVTFVVRTQDDNGEWYFGMATTSLASLKSGAEVRLTPHKRLIVQEVGEINENQ